eukprot:GEMP01009640.1.p1 GENE.GEMP01009640.1~~GEMP01009640.1.p1  ORF type:complete len:922 (+),score=160.68 GEMP01009640.1:634-3399(+)
MPGRSPAPFNYSKFQASHRCGIRTNELPNHACFQALFGNSDNSADFRRIFEAASFALYSEDRYNINAASPEFCDDDLWKRLGLGADLYSELEEAFSAVHKCTGQSVPDQMREIGWVLYSRCVDMALEAINNALHASGQEVVSVFCAPGFDCVRCGNHNDLFSNSLFESALSGFFRLAGLPETPALHALQDEHGILAVLDGPKAVNIRHIREAIDSGMRKIQREKDLGPNANVLCMVEPDLSLSLCHGMYQCFCNYRLASETPSMPLAPLAMGWRSVVEKSIYPCIRKIAKDKNSVVNTVSFSNWRDKLKEFNAITFHRCVVVLPSIEYILPTCDWYRLGKSITRPLSIPRPIFLWQYRELFPTTCEDLWPHIARLGLAARDDVVIFWTRKLRRDIRKMKSRTSVSQPRHSSPSSVPRLGTPSRRFAHLDVPASGGLDARFSPSSSSSPTAHASVHMSPKGAHAARMSSAASPVPGVHTTCQPRAGPLRMSVPDYGRSHRVRGNMGELSRAISCDVSESARQGPLDVTFMSPHGIPLRGETPRPLLTPRRTPSAEARVEEAVQAWITRSDTSPALLGATGDGETGHGGEHEAPRSMLSQCQRAAGTLDMHPEARKLHSRVCESPPASYIQQRSTDSSATSTQCPSSTGARTSFTSTSTSLHRPSTVRGANAPHSLISSQDTVHTSSSSRNSPPASRLLRGSSSSSATAGPACPYGASVNLNGSVSSTITLERTQGRISAPMYSTSSTSSRDDGYVAGPNVRSRVRRPKTMPGVDWADAVGSGDGRAVSGLLREDSWRTDHVSIPSVSHSTSSVSSLDRMEDIAERQRRMREELGERERRLEEREKKLEAEQRRVQLQQQAAQFKQKTAEDALAYVEAEARNLKKSNRELTQLKKQLRGCLAAHARHDVATEYNLPDPPDWAL